MTQRRMNITAPRTPARIPTVAADLFGLVVLLVTTFSGAITDADGDGDGDGVDAAGLTMK